MNRFILVFMISVLLAACQSAPPKPPLTITPIQTAARPTPTAAVITPTLTPTLVLPSATPSVVPTRTATPTPAPMSVVKEENGWVTYRNEIVGYEISAPKSYRNQRGIP